MTFKLWYSLLLIYHASHPYPYNEKSAQTDANTARQQFSPRRRPLSWGRSLAGPPKFNF